MRIIVGITLVVLVTTVVTAFRRRHWIPLSEDEGRTRLGILQRVPLGTGVDSAQRAMERGGFQCLVEMNVDLRPDPWTKRLYCWRSKWAWIGERDWRVSLMLGRDDRVAEVAVTYAITGP